MQTTLHDMEYAAEQEAYRQTDRDSAEADPGPSLT